MEVLKRSQVIELNKADPKQLSFPFMKNKAVKPEILSQYGGSRIIRTKTGLIRMQNRHHGAWNTVETGAEAVQRWNGWAPDHKRVDPKMTGGLMETFRQAQKEHKATWPEQRAGKLVVHHRRKGLLSRASEPPTAPKKYIKTLDNILERGVVSSALKDALAELKDAINRKDWNEAYEISAVKSYISGALEESKEGNMFSEDSEKNEKALGKDVYSLLDTMHHDIAFSQKKMPSGMMVFGTTPEGKHVMQQKGPGKGKAKTIGLIKREHDLIVQESEKRQKERESMRKADVHSYARRSRKGLIHHVRDHKRLDPSKRVSLRLMQVLDGMKYRQKKDLHDKIMGQIKEVKEKVLKGEGSVTDIYGLVKMTTDLEKARVQVKPYQRKGRMVLGYSQERKAGVGEGQPNYDKGIKEIASDVRTDLKKRFPDCKFSVTIERYSMGQSLHINLMEAPFDILEPVERVEEYYRKEHPTGKSEQDLSMLTGHQKYALENGYAQLNEYQILKPTWEKERLSNGVMLTEKGWQMLQQVCGIALKDHYDHSDPMTDYFDTNYYFHLNIGKWNKPFVKTGADVEKVGESQTKYGIKYDPKKMEAFIAKDAFLQFVAKRGMKPEVMFNTYIVGDSAMENAYQMADMKAFDFRKFAKEVVG